MAGAADCGETCVYTHVHHINGVPVGTICEQSGFCWTVEKERLAERKRFIDRYVFDANRGLIAERQAAAAAGEEPPEQPTWRELHDAAEQAWEESLQPVMEQAA